MSVVAVVTCIFIGGMVGVCLTMVAFWKYTAYLNKEIGRLQAKLKIFESINRTNQKLKLIMSFIDIVDSFFPIKRRR